MGEPRTAPGGVFDCGTHEEDGPETWEALTLLVTSPDQRRSGDQTPTRSVSAGRVSRRLLAQHRTSARDEAGPQGNWEGATSAEADGGEGVGGLHTSYDVGERDGARTRPSDAARVGVNFRRDP